MTLAAIKHAVTNGQTVCWSNTGYRVELDSIGQWLIVCQWNQSCSGLESQWKYCPSDFFIAPSDSQ
mgnify:CR=1 FL=1